MVFCFFASDLHGRIEPYEKLLDAVEREAPAALFLGGDLLPPGFLPTRTFDPRHEDFINGFLVIAFERLRERLGARYPEVFLILGNDDARFEEAAFVDAATRELWHYVHGRSLGFRGYRIYGYSCVPPTPFLLKDWERYDVSRHVDPGCSPPEEGWRTFPVASDELRYGTIREDLSRLAGDDPMESAVFLFHSPPYRSKLDRAALDGKTVDHVPLDVHVGSIAIRRFIEARQPLVTLHGHVHESPRLTGSWSDRIGRTHMFSAAHEGPELALIRFDLEDLATATRELV